jgi:hypothetical protein
MSERHRMPPFSLGGGAHVAKHLLLVDSVLKPAPIGTVGGYATSTLATPRCALVLAIVRPRLKTPSRPAIYFDVGVTSAASTGFQLMIVSLPRAFKCARRARHDQYAQSNAGS